MNDSDITVKILFLAAEPSDEARLRLLQELRDIRKTLQLSKDRGFKLESRESVRVEDITQAIFDVNPQIVHFSGHGTSTGELHFENLTGKSQLVPPDALAALFERFAEKIDCVVLSACYSEISAKAIAQYIRFVIGMNQNIGDKAAIAFSVGFYKALAANYSIEEAYEFGCVEIRLYNLPEHLKPVLHKNPTAKPRVKPIIPNPFVPQNGRVEQPEQFFGRQREIQRVFEVLNSGSSVALIGKDGLGKSSLLWEICRVAENRLQQERQAVFFDLNDVGDEKDFYIALCDKVAIAECKGYKLTRNLRQRDKKVLLALDNVGKLTWKGFTRQVRDQLRGLAELSQNPIQRQLLFQGVVLTVVTPLLLCVILQRIGIFIDWFGVAWGVRFSVGFGGVFGVVLGVALGVGFGVALGVGFGVVLGVGFGVVLGVGFGVAWGVALGVVWVVALGVALSVGFGVGSGVALGVALGMVWIVAWGVAFVVVLSVAVGMASSVAWGVTLGMASGVAILRLENWLLGLPFFIQMPQNRRWQIPHVTPLPLYSLSSQLKSWLHQDWETGLYNANQLLAYTLQFIPIVKAVNQVLAVTPP